VTTENITVLFTDLVGSTALQSSVNPEVADELRRNHFTVLRQAIAETGGREVKNLGDGLMVVFGSASAGLSCAVTMQQRFEIDRRRQERAIGLRVGLSAGEVTREDDDYFGDPVIEAARLCARCDGGQVLATDVVRLTAGRRNPYGSRPLGPLGLKGLPDPVEVLEVLWEPLGAETAEHPTLPSLLTESGRFPFAGRQRESESLIDAFSTVTTGATRLVLIAGEPGIGKTRLTSELAELVLVAGGLVLAGRSDELVGVPYQPFVEALRWRIAQPAGVDRLGSRAGELVRFVPELANVVPNLRPPIASTPEAERLALFEAVREWLAALTTDHPVLLVLDDLHWADMASLLLLRHVVANDPVPGLLVVATYRDTELDRTHPLANLLAEFHRRGDVERIVLSGLDEGEVTDLMRQAAGHDLDEGAINLAMTLKVDTGGNPFFVGEVLRHLVESGVITQEGGRWVAAQNAGEPYLPEGIRQVVGRRLSALPDASQKLLSSASVIGTRFDLDLLATVSGSTSDDVLDAVEPALAAHLVLEIGIGNYQFAHALVRSTLHGELSTTRRARLHHAVAQALETLHADDLDSVTSDLAYHWGEAGAPNNAAAFTFAKRAAELAMERVAPDEAVRWYRIARERLDGADPALNAELLCRLGQSEALAGEVDWQSTLLDAARAAEAIGATALMAEALGVNMRTSIEMVAGTANPDKIALLERALAATTDDVALAARLMFTLSSEILYTGDFARRGELFKEASSLLEQVADPLERTRIQAGQYASIPYSAIDSRWLDDLSRESSAALRLARARSDHEMEFICLTGLCFVSWRGAGGESTFIDQMDQVLGLFPNPLFRIRLLGDKACRSLKQGRFADASMLTESVVRASRALGISNSAPRALARLQQVRESDGLGAVVEAVLSDPLLVVEKSHSLPGPRTAMAAWALAEAGRLAEARRLIEECEELGFVNMPDDAGLPITRVAWVEAATLTGDLAACRALYDLLLPYHDIFQVTGGWYAGSTARYLALLATALGHEAEADRWFAQGVEDHTRVGTPPWLARTRVDWAEYLLRRGEVEGARELALAALDEVGDLELSVVCNRAKAVLDSTT